MNLAVKFTGKDIIEGLAIPFGSSDDRDLDGEYFTKNTDLCVEWFGTAGRPFLYDHGLDDSLKTVPMGRQTEFEVRDEGVWATVQLERNARYRKAVDKLIAEGALGYSSGAMPHLTVKSKAGEITRWPWVELSGTPIPAHPGTLVHYVKSSDAIAHMEEADIEVPAALKAALVALDEWADTRGDPPAGEPFADNAGRVLADVKALSARFESIAEMRAKAGRTISRSNWERIRTLAESMKTGFGDLETFLAEHDPDAETKRVREELDRAVLSAQRVLVSTL